MVRCTESFYRLATRLNLGYLRWTNTHPANHRHNADTVVHVEEFLHLLEEANSLASTRIRDSHASTGYSRGLR